MAAERGGRQESACARLCGGPKGDDLKAGIEKSAYPGKVKTTLDGTNQMAYRTGETETAARGYFMYYSGKDPSAVRYKNWKTHFAVVSDAPSGFIAGVQPYHWTQVVNIRRDPFETAVRTQIKTLMGAGGAVTSVKVVEFPV